MCPHGRYPQRPSTVYLHVRLSTRWFAEGYSGAVTRRGHPSNGEKEKKKKLKKVDEKVEGWFKKIRVELFNMASKLSYSCPSNS
jgi:hypothetical protein